MDVLLARTLDEALEMKTAHPEGLPIAGGTDVMVELNFDLRRPEVMIDICRSPELREWRREDGELFLGAGVTDGRIMRELADLMRHSRRHPARLALRRSGTVERWEARRPRIRRTDGPACLRRRGVRGGGARAVRHVG
jgi:CO/xanthine dehydrogenase FAD-binding subunit